MALKQQNYSWWRFFDKAGDSTNFSYDETLDKWTGNIYIKEVSAGLIEYEPLYLLEQIYNGVLQQQMGLRYPKKLNFTSLCPGATQTDILCRWTDDNKGSTFSNVPEIFLWSIANFPGPTATLVKHDSLTITLPEMLGDTVGDGTIGGTGQPVYNGAGSSAAFLDESLSLRVGLGATFEGSFNRTLQLIDPDYLTEATVGATFPGCTTSEHVFAEITFYGETEGEDVRLDTMLENLGDTIKNSDFKIFDDVDINEALPDYIKLNTKRKELLLEWDNIFPFTGSYKALINILKYFGYDQVTLKEYWLNIDELKGLNEENESKIVYKQTPIEDLFSTDPKTTGYGTSAAPMIPSKVFKKTNKFGLFYNITEDSGVYDNDGIPITKESFLFSNEEVLIKLFALKQKLKNYFLPLNARIVDIVGEAVYYARYDVNVWSDLLRVDDVELNISPCVSILPEDGCSLVTDLTAQQFVGIKVPPDLNMAGVSDFTMYAIGVTQTDTTTGLEYNHSGVNDEYLITDTISGSSFSYYTNQAGLTSGQIVEGIKTKFETLSTEPWSSFNLVRDLSQDPSGMTAGPYNLQSPTYQWFYLVQDDVIGNTGGVGATFTLTTIPGATSGVYTTPGGTYTTDLMTLAAPNSWGSSPLSFYSSAFMGYFNGYDRNVDELNDYPCAPIAAPFVLTNCSFNMIWDQAEVSWNATDYVMVGSTGNPGNFNYSYFNYTYTSGSYPLGGSNSFIGATGITYSGPSGGTAFWPFGATPGSSYHPPGPTYINGWNGLTGPTNNPILYNWNNLAYGDFHEMQWIITYENTPTPTGATSYVIDSGLLSLELGASYPILLKYEGTYKVELRLYDSLGSYSSWIQNGALCVDIKDVDFLGHYTSRECDYTWSDPTIIRQSDQVPAPTVNPFPLWSDYNSTWALPLQANEQMSMQDLTYNDLDSIEFYQTQNDPQYQGFCDTVSTLPQVPGVSGSTGLYDLNSYIWNLIENESTWEDVCHLWWDDMHPKVAQARIKSPTSFGTFAEDLPTLAFYKETNQIGTPRDVILLPILSDLNLLNNPAYGDIVKIMDPGATGISNVYQYLGGATGITGGSSWLESDITIDTFTFSEPLLTTYPNGVNDTYREVVRQINERLETTGASHSYINEFITYYEEEYDDPSNVLIPYIQFVSKNYDKDKRYFIKYYGNGPTATNPGSYTPLTIYNGLGAGSTYISTYETINFGSMGDIPYFFEMFSVGPSGGTIWLPGTSAWLGSTGGTVTGITHWPYNFGATDMPDLWQQLVYTSLSQAPTGPFAGASSIYMDGPILDYEWNLVWGAGGYTGPTGPTVFPPPSGLVPIKIQGNKEYFSSHDYACVKFTGSTAVGATTGTGIGGTSGIAGTMCGRSITANSDWNTLRIHKYAKNFPLLTQIQFNYSSSTMDGKTYPTWTLIKENDNSWVNIYYNNPYFAYTFTQTGSYTIELKISDNNGNTKTKTKKEFVKII